VPGAAVGGGAREHLVPAAIEALGDEREDAADGDAGDGQKRSPDVAPDAAGGVPPGDPRHGGLTP
jgi:hypothetical protein